MSRGSSSRTPPPQKTRVKPAFVFDSDLAFDLMRDWSVGHCSAIHVNSLAAKSHKDHCNVLDRVGLSQDFAPQSLSALAGLGSAGKFPGNCKAELMNLLGHPDTPECTCVSVPMNISKPSETEESVEQVLLPVNLPHEQFAWLYHSHYDTFAKIFLDGDHSGMSLEHFWAHIKKVKDPRLESHDTSTKPKAFES